MEAAKSISIFLFGVVVAIMIGYYGCSHTSQPIDILPHISMEDVNITFWHDHNDWNIDCMMAAWKEKIVANALCNWNNTNENWKNSNCFYNAYVVGNHTIEHHAIYSNVSVSGKNGHVISESWMQYGLLEAYDNLYNHNKRQLFIGITTCSALNTYYNYDNLQETFEKIRNHNITVVLFVINQYQCDLQKLDGSIFDRLGFNRLFSRFFENSNVHIIDLAALTKSANSMGFFARELIGIDRVYPTLTSSLFLSTVIDAVKTDMHLYA